MDRRVNRWVPLVGLSLLMGCAETSSGPGAQVDSLTGEPDAVLPILEIPQAGCEIPEGLAEDPLTSLSRTPYKKAHFQDIGYERARGIIFVAG